MRVEDPHRPGISLHSSKQRFWIDYAIDWTRFQRISWKELDREVDRDPRVFRDRLVIVGGDFVASGDELHRVPHLGGSPPEVSGLVLQALIADTMLTGLPIHDAGMVLVLLGVALGSTIVGAAFLCLRHLPLSVCTLVAIVAVFLTVALVDFRQNHVVVPVTGPVMTLGAIALLGLGLRRKLASFPDLYQEAR
jgi:CHASE2 domain-containing sensor protein